MNAKDQPKAVEEMRDYLFKLTQKDLFDPILLTEKFCGNVHKMDVNDSFQCFTYNEKIFEISVKEIVMESINNKRTKTESELLIPDTMKD